MDLDETQMTRTFIQRRQLAGNNNEGGADSDSVEEADDGTGKADGRPDERNDGHDLTNDDEEDGKSQRDQSVSGAILPFILFFY